MKPSDPDWPRCACGCGEPVPVRKASKSEKGWKVGDPCLCVADHAPRARRVPHVDGQKRCPRCGAMKPLADFSAARSRPDGLSSWCRPCVNAHRQKWAAANKDRIAASSRARRAKNPESGRAAAARWIEKHPERAREIARLHAAARRARLRGSAFVEHVHPLIVLERADGVCGICGEDVDPLSFAVDHVVPLARGGDHSYANTQPAHASCNSRKHTKLPEEMH